MSRVALIGKALLMFLTGLLVLGAVFFLSAGTMGYWPAWAYMSVLFVPMSFVVLYFILKDPAFLERRMKMKEKESRQRSIIKATALIFIIGFLLPGLDWRFGWSQVPPEVVVGANMLVLIGYFIVFLAFRENSYAARTIEVEKGQKLISTGPYSIVRHPMYVGVLLMYLATPVALGSYWALPLFLLLIPAIVLRTQNEEEVLRRELPGYKAYCKKIRYRLIPYVW